MRDFGEDVLLKDLEAYVIQEINVFAFFAEWLDNTFIPTNQQRLRNAHKMACDALREVGIQVLPGECGLFIWVDFREVEGVLFVLYLCIFL